MRRGKIEDESEREETIGTVMMFVEKGNKTGG